MKRRNFEKKRITHFISENVFNLKKNNNNIILLHENEFYFQSKNIKK